jgi:hypothetical protein
MLQPHSDLLVLVVAATSPLKRSGGWGPGASDFEMSTDVYFCGPSASKKHMRRFTT